MSTIQHPKFTQSSFKGPEYQTTLTTYDLVSTSPSKLKYTFGNGKGDRFPKVVAKTQQIGYTLPSTKGSRAAGFGIGERFSDQKIALKKNTNPSPDRYNIPTVFQPNNTTSTFAVHVKGDTTYCFGTGRDGFSKQVMEGNLKPDPQTPGPGTYDPLQPIGKNARAFTLKGRLEYGDQAMMDIKRNVPPPGLYGDQLATDGLGNYNQNSEFSNSKAARWGKPHDRFKVMQTTDQITPGPGTHMQHGELASGTQINSQYHSIRSPSFKKVPNRANSQVPRFATPGPGHYRPPSDFGYIDLMPKPSFMTRRNQNTAIKLDDSMMSKINRNSSIQHYETIHEQIIQQSRNKKMNKTSLGGHKTAKYTLQLNKNFSSYQNNQSPIKSRAARTGMSFNQRNNSLQMEDSQIKKFANLTLKDMRRGSQPGTHTEILNSYSKQEMNSTPIKAVTPMNDQKRPEFIGSSQITMDDTNVVPSMQE